MASIINLSESILHHLIVNNDAEPQKVFPEEVFETPSIAIFSSGWLENSDYPTWAKFDELDLQKVAVPLGISSPKLKREFKNLSERYQSPAGLLISRVGELRNSLMMDSMRAPRNPQGMP